MLFIYFLLLSANSMAQSYNIGDVNRDKTVDISDIVAVINTIAGERTYVGTADVNGDKAIDISDIVAIINIIANGGGDVEVDENSINLSDLTKIIVNETDISVVNGEKTTSYKIEEGLNLRLVNPGNKAENKFLDIYIQGKNVASLPFTGVERISFGENGNLTFWNKDGIVYQATSKVDNILVYDKAQDPLVYLGIIGFNQDLYKQPFGILAQSTASAFNDFVNNLTYSDGTILYYAVDNALDILTNYRFSTSLSSVNLITFTDGLDQGSLMMNGKYSTETAYLNALSSRIGNMKVAGIPLTAYSLGLRGNDVNDNTMFTTNLSGLASSNEKAIEVKSIYDVENQLQEIADQIINVSSCKNISVRIPGPSTGTTVRFVFDGKSPEKSELYIEGVFNMSDMSLKNMRYHGFKSTSGTIVKGTRDGIFVSFSFTGLQLSDGSGQFSTSNIKQYNNAPNSTTWQVNSEFSPDSNVQTTVTYSGCAIMLVLDCSRSLGSDFSRMQTYVKNFINKIAKSTSELEMQAPSGVKARLTGDDGQLGVELSWLASKHADSYIIYRSSSASGSYTKIADNITSTMWKDPSPLSGMNYYKVVAVGSGLQSTQSAYASVNYELAVPQGLSAKLAERDGKLVADLSWSASQYAQSYTVYRSSSANGSYTVVAEGITSTSWSDTTPISGSCYYTVAAVANGRASEMSPYAYVEFTLTPPTDLSASMAGRDGKLVVDLSWKKSSSQYAQSYTVYRSDSASGTFSVVAEGITSTSWADPYPLSGWNYYKVSASGFGITSSQSSSVSVNYALAPPSYLSASMVEHNGSWGVDLSWAASQYALGYTVYRSDSYAGNYTIVAENVTSTSWTDSSPLPGLNFYKVSATGSGIDSAQSYSATVNFTIASPTDLSASLADRNGQPVINLSWSASQDARTYTVYRSGNPSETYNVVAEGVTTTSWTDASPMPGNNYYQVAAESYGVLSDKSSYAFAKFAIAPPTELSASMVERNGKKVVDLSWTASKYAQIYTVYRSDNASWNYSVVADNVISNSWTDSSPLAGSNYYKITASGYGVTSDKSNSVSCFNDPSFNVNGVEFKMIPVAGGSFMMGDNNGESNEKPVHQVTLSDFYIGQTEVTQELWEAVMGANPSYWKGPKLPVEKVSWSDCQTFITKLNTLTGQKFRLPTEAEWEYAARGGNQSKGYTYSGSDNIDDVAWYSSNSGSKTHDVATKAPNELGIYDMSGNVWEWCQDLYGSYSSGSQTNPQGPSSGSYRVCRGGGWYGNATNCRCANRSSRSPSNTGDNLGFRLAL